MKKPTKKSKEPRYDWHDIEAYMDEKCGKKLRDWGCMFHPEHNQNNPYQDFWHWMVDNYGLSNGSEFDLEIDPEAYVVNYDAPEWVLEILTKLNEEFPEAEGVLECEVNW